MPAPSVSVSGDRTSSLRSRLMSFLVVLAAVAVLGAGVWGVLASLESRSEPARMGEPVGVSGSQVRVDDVTPEHMAPMRAGKFAASGMSMSAMGMDMAPEGYRRFSAGVTLSAGGSDLAYKPQDFLVSGEGMEETGPLRSQLDTGTVTAGGTVSGNLLFQVPEDATDLKLSFDGGRSISLGLSPAPKKDEHNHEDHSHGH